MLAVGRAQLAVQLSDLLAQLIIGGLQGGNVVLQGLGLTFVETELISPAIQFLLLYAQLRYGNAALMEELTI